MEQAVAIFASCASRTRIVKCVLLRFLSRAVIATSAAACAWGLLVFCISMVTREWTERSVFLVGGLLALSFLASLLVLRLTPSKLQSAERGRGRSASVSSLKAVCMVFVAIIHSGCSESWNKYFVYRNIVDRAVPLLFVSMGVTCLGASNKYNLVDRYVALLGPYYTYMVLVSAYRYVDGTELSYHEGYSPRDRFRLHLQRLLGFAPCLYGAWFVFPMFQILLLTWVASLARSRRTLVAAVFPQSILFGAMCTNFLKDEMSSLTLKFSGGAALDCDLFGLIYSLSLWNRFIGYVVSGMWFATLHHQIRSWAWSVPAAVLAFVAAIFGDRMGDKTLERDLAMNLSTICLAFAVIIFFDRFPWLRRAHWLGDCSWTVYLGQISFLQLVGDGCSGLIDGFVKVAPHIVFVQLALALGWLFSLLACRDRLAKAMAPSCQSSESSRLPLLAKAPQQEKNESRVELSFVSNGL